VYLILISKPAKSAVVMSRSSPVFDYRDVGGRAMPGAIAEKIRR
jgi:hypothetical protein